MQRRTAQGDGPGYRPVPIRRVEVYRQVLTEIEAFIENNSLVPGDRLPSDRDLATMLHVSRVSVRQALKVLEGLGRIGAQHGSGTYVREPGFTAAIADLTRGLPIDRSLANQVVPIHRAVQLAVLETAFVRRTDEHVAHVRTALERRRRELADDPEEGSLEFSFETSLGEVCGNPLLRRLQAVMQELFVRAWAASGEVPGTKRRLFEEHVGVFERFAEGDLLGALARFREHLSFPPVVESVGSLGGLGNGVVEAEAGHPRAPTAISEPATDPLVSECSTQAGGTI